MCPTSTSTKLHYHLPLGDYHEEGRKALQHVRGVTVAQATGGYFLNLSLVPRDPTSS